MCTNTRVVAPYSTLGRVNVVGGHGACRSEIVQKLAMDVHGWW